MGSTGLTAGMYGSRSREGCIRVLYLSLGLAGAIGLMVICLQLPLRHLLMTILNPASEVRQAAIDYFNITVWGIPAQLLLMSLTGWIIGLQNTMVPMAIAIGVNVINMAISFLLAITFGFGIKGIACGTLISNWLSALTTGLVAMIWIKGNKGPIGKTMAEALNDTHGKKEIVRISEFFKVNGDLFLRSAFLLVVSMAMTAFGAKMGDLALGVNAVMMQYFLFFSYFMDGFAFAGEALVGRYRGMGSAKDIKGSVRQLLKWGIGMSVLFLLLYAVLSDGITSLLTNLPEVRAGVRAMRIWILILPPLTVLAFIFDGIYIGLTDTRRMLYATLLGAITFFAISCNTGHPTHNNNILWLAFESYLIVRGLWLACNYFISKRKFVNLQ